MALRQLNRVPKFFLVRYLCDQKLQVRGRGYFRINDSNDVNFIGLYEVQWGRPNQVATAMVLASGDEKEMRAELERRKNEPSSSAPPASPPSSPIPLPPLSPARSPTPPPSSAPPPKRQRTLNAKKPAARVLHRATPPGYYSSSDDSDAEDAPLIIRSEPSVAVSTPLTSSSEPSVAVSTPVTASSEPSVAVSTPVTASSEPSIAVSAPVTTSSEPSITHLATSSSEPSVFTISTPSTTPVSTLASRRPTPLPSLFRFPSHPPSTLLGGPTTPSCLSPDYRFRPLRPDTESSALNSISTCLTAIQKSFDLQAKLLESTNKRLAAHETDIKRIESKFDLLLTRLNEGGGLVPPSMFSEDDVSADTILANVPSDVAIPDDTLEMLRRESHVF